MFPNFSTKKKTQRKVIFVLNYFFIPLKIKLDFNKPKADAPKIKVESKPNLCPLLVIYMRKPYFIFPI